MNVGTFKDTAIIGFGSLPADIPPEAVVGGVVDLNQTPGFREKLLDAGTMLAGSQGGRACLMQSQHWTVTSDPEQLAAWQPICDCDRCTGARDQAVITLRASPAGWMAFCDMEYTLVR